VFIFRTETTLKRVSPHDLRATQYHMESYFTQPCG